MIGMSSDNSRDDIDLSSGLHCPIH